MAYSSRVFTSEELTSMSIPELVQRVESFTTHMDPGLRVNRIVANMLGQELLSRLQASPGTAPAVSALLKWQAE